jgi:hypothetical protein
MTGTESHPKRIAATSDNKIRTTLDKLFFRLKFLNFKAIRGSLLIIPRQSNKMIVYKIHLFNNKLTIQTSTTF